MDRLDFLIKIKDRYNLDLNNLSFADLECLYDDLNNYLNINIEIKNG